MESVLALICIVFFAVLTYGFIQGANLDRFHVQSCRNIYVPEDMDLSVAIQSIHGLDKERLKKRARDLGAKKSFVDTLSESDLKVYIVQNSVSNEHINFEELESVIKKRESERWTRRTKEPPQGQSKFELLLQKPEITIKDLRKDAGLDD